MYIYINVVSVLQIYWSMNVGTCITTILVHRFMKIRDKMFIWKYEFFRSMLEIHSFN